jgi:hypothetical protein
LITRVFNPKFNRLGKQVQNDKRIY